MADARDSESPTGSSSGPSPEQWTRLCNELGTSDPTEIIARVQTLKRELDQPDQPEQSDEGLVTISEVEEVFREMNRKIDSLRERNSELADRLEEEGDDTDRAFKKLHQGTEQLLETLDATSIDEARQRVRKLHQRLEALYREKETLAQAGFSDSNEAIGALNRLREERNALQQERDQLQADRKRLKQQLEDATQETSSGRSADPDTSVLEAAVVIRDRIGVSSPAEAEAFTKIVEQLYDRVRARAEPHGIETDQAPGDVVDMLRHMSQHLDSMPDPGALPENLSDLLGVSTGDEIRSLVERLRSLRAHLAERTQSALAGEGEDDEASDVISLVGQVETAVHSLDGNGTGDPDDDALPPEVGDILGIRTVEDAHELEELIANMSDQLERLHEEHEKLERAGLSVDGAMAMIDNMEDQLLDLYHSTASGMNGTETTVAGVDVLEAPVRDRLAELTDVRVEEVGDLADVVAHLTERLETVHERQAVLHEAGLSADEAVTMIESMEVQLEDLYRAREEDERAASRLAGIEDVLGISTAEEAEELSQLARQMEDQLSTLYQEKARLEDLGLASIEDAVDMIQSMEDQLTDLYGDKEALQNVQPEDASRQSTFEQLETLYAEQEKLQQMLGVSSADDVIELVESLSAQLDDMYEARDANADPADRAEALLWDPEVDVDEDDEEQRDDGAALTMNSMEHQLEALYREKETLLHHGFSDAQEVVQQLQTQQKQIDALQRENHTYERQFDRLKAEVGTGSISQLVEIVQTLASKSNTSLDDLVATTSAASDTTEYGVDIEATSPFVADETLAHLDDMEDEDLDSLDTGVIRLREDGTVEYLNEAALQLPGLQSVEDRAEIVGANFFLDLAPSTNNNLFYGRFQKGQRRGTMDARFPYTFTSPDEGPQPFDVHLHRKSDSEATWLLFRPT